MLSPILQAHLRGKMYLTVGSIFCVGIGSEGFRYLRILKRTSKVIYSKTRATFTVYFRYNINGFAVSRC